MPAIEPNEALSVTTPAVNAKGDKMIERVEWNGLPMQEAERIRDTIESCARQNGVASGDVCISGDGKTADVRIEVDGDNAPFVDDLKARGYLGLPLPLEIRSSS